MPLNIPYDAAYLSTNTTDKLFELVKELNSPEGAKATKSLNYYDGMQEEEVIKFFAKHRKDWKNDSLIPRSRNITKMIVEKSGQIIHDTPPIYEVQTAALVTDEASTENLIDLFEKADSVETWLNLDEMVRLLKTTLVLVGWDDETQCLVYDLLHRGNSLVRWNNVTKVPELLLYNLFANSKFESYRLIVSDQIIDFDFEFGTKQVTIKAVDENPLGIVPAAQFYDTTAPRVGFWNIVPTDLVNVNEMYNIAMSDSEYSMSWMKRPTLFTNALLGEAHELEETSQSHTHGKLEGRPAVKVGIKFGPSSAVQLDTNGVDGVFLDFKAPVVDLKAIDSVVNDWVEAVASDWSVRATVGGQGSANSGFQLIVEELPNLELRKQRQKMFAVGLTRLFEVVKVVVNTHGTVSFDPGSKLFVTYAEPTLPVESKLEEEIWTTKIAEGRASLVDYFVETKGMSQDEAIEKIAEIIEFTETQRKFATTQRVVADVRAEDIGREDTDQGDE